jgi:signal transduction histidine kinase
LTDEEVIQIKQDKARNYIFTTFAGVSILSKDKKMLTNYPRTATQNLQLVQSCTEDTTGALWFSTATGSGLYRLNRTTQTFRRFTMDDGLPNNMLVGSVIDRVGNLWISTRRGLVKVEAQKLVNFDSFIQQENASLFTTYTPEDGYFGHGDGRSYISLDKYNRLWVPLAQNLRIVNLDEEQKPQKNIQVELTDVGLFNEKVAWLTDSTFQTSYNKNTAGIKFDSLSKWHQVPLGLQLTHNKNHLNFSFAAVNSSSSKAISYTYKLAGFDPNWNKTTNPEAIYTNLSAGKYVLKIKAMNASGEWSETLAYPFSMLPPWWLTWWAKALYVVIAAAGIYLFTKFRVNQQLKKVKELEAIRTKISADLHDDVGSILSGLSMQSQMMALTASTDLKKSLHELSDMSHDAMDSMRDTVWAIDPRKDKVENLIDRMRSFAEKNLALKGIKHSFTIDFENPKSFINPEKRQNCYLIFKEAITNICKHSDAKFVKISFKKVNDELQLIIHDNGSEQASYISGGSGMNNMKMRATKVNGFLTTQYIDGFKVWFAFNKD